jgi:hypothetical protein
MCAGKWLKILVPEYKTPLWTRERLVAGKCKLCLQQVFRSWISEFDGKKSLCLTTNITNEKNILGRECQNLVLIEYRIFRPIARVIYTKKI